MDKSITRIRVIDLETTGETPPEARICEVGWADVVATQRQEDGTPAGWEVQGPDSVLINPFIPIPPEVSAIHHIIDEDVKGAYELADVLDNLLGTEFRSDEADCPDAFAAHQAKFERQFITDEMTGGRPWICTYRCALRLWPEAPSHSNQALRYFRKPEGLDRNLAMVAHRAGPDAYVTAFHLRDMLNGGAKVEHLVIRSSQPALLVNCQIGDHRGKKWSQVPVGFLQWMLGKNFDEDAMHTARHWIKQHDKAQTAAILGEANG